MFNKFDKLESGEGGKIIKYHEVQTSAGQSGSPLVLKQNNTYQIIGVHTGSADSQYNIGIFIDSLSYNSFKQIFCADNQIQQNLFDQFLKHQVELYDQYFREAWEAKKAEEAFYQYLIFI